MPRRVPGRPAGSCRPCRTSSGRCWRRLGLPSPPDRTLPSRAAAASSGSTLRSRSGSSGRSSRPGSSRPAARRPADRPSWSCRATAVRPPRWRPGCRHPWRPACPLATGCCALTRGARRARWRRAAAGRHDERQGGESQARGRAVARRRSGDRTWFALVLQATACRVVVTHDRACRNCSVRASGSTGLGVLRSPSSRSSALSGASVRMVARPRRWSPRRPVRTAARPRRWSPRPGDRPTDRIGTGKVNGDQVLAVHGPHHHGLERETRSSGQRERRRDASRPIASTTIARKSAVLTSPAVNPRRIPSAVSGPS